MLIEKMPSPSEMKKERYFQIRDVGKDGCGSYEAFCVSGDTKENDIGNIASEVWTNTMLWREKRHFPSMFRQPPKWRQTISVVEIKRDIKKLDKTNERTGRDYENVFTTKRGGFKFKIHNNYVKIIMKDGSTYAGNGYKFYNA